MGHLSVGRQVAAIRFCHLEGPFALRTEKSFRDCHGFAVHELFCRYPRMVESSFGEGLSYVHSAYTRALLMVLLSVCVQRASTC